MKKLVILCSALFTFTFAAQAQQTGLPVSDDQAAVEQTANTPLYKERKKTSFLENPDKTDFDLQIGTSVGTNFRNGSYWSNYAAPSLRYNLHPRWNLSVGTMFVNTQFNSPMMASEGAGTGRINNFQTFVYTQGQYMASERLRLTGTAFYELNQFSGPALRMNPQATNLTSKGASIYAEYKVSEHFSIGAGAQISNGNNYLRNGLYGNPGIYTPGMPFNSMGAW
ncbi:hypothetical protein Q0590_16635 [Rhodocytophaga aerolata]|uniref:Outer membrane beta-barrel protein n=1 Tax=Rhodocytophaga aerolata TaxID=455078 RepID=A0ABT8R716_9BACT|nr:hypothetical protein [Rhodocytophaga aerolata]MDO1447900.1 hypothetical protein [Rhodocytophaga aerolata]